MRPRRTWGVSCLPTCSMNKRVERMLQPITPIPEVFVYMRFAHISCYCCNVCHPFLATIQYDSNLGSMYFFLFILQVQFQHLSLIFFSSSFHLHSFCTRITCSFFLVVHINFYLLSLDVHTLKVQRAKSISAVLQRENGDTKNGTCEGARVKRKSQFKQVLIIFSIQYIFYTSVYFTALIFCCLYSISCHDIQLSYTHANARIYKYIKHFMLYDTLIRTRTKGREKKK